MKKSIFLAVLLALLIGLTDAWAWRPDGWVYHDWPWQYSVAETNWYYFNETQDMEGYDLAASSWGALSELNATWLHFAWPYAYVLNHRGWVWMNETNVLWCLQPGRQRWSRYGTVVDQAPTNGFAWIPGATGVSIRIPMAHWQLHIFSRRKHYTLYGPDRRGLSLYTLSITAAELAQASKASGDDGTLMVFVNTREVETGDLRNAGWRIMRPLEAQYGDADRLRPGENR